jgi:hypothetical protein
MNSLVAFKLIKSSVASVREEIILKKMNPKWMKNVVLMTIKDARQCGCTVVFFLWW